MVPMIGCETLLRVNTVLFFSVGGSHRLRKSVQSGSALLLPLHVLKSWPSFCLFLSLFPYFVSSISCLTHISVLLFHSLSLHFPLPLLPHVPKLICPLTDLAQASCFWGDLMSFAAFNQPIKVHLMYLLMVCPKLEHNYFTLVLPSSIQP